MISVDIHSKRFGDTQVLGRVRFELGQGESLAVLGPSGVGKSTLLRIVGGIDRKFEGHVERPQRMGVVFQEPTLLPWRTALENLTLVHRGLSEAEGREALERVGIGDRAELFPGQLSLGQQRRLALARAFAGAPEFLVMDEPFVSLDAELAEGMMRLTEALIAEVRPAVLLVTHAREEAERLAGRIAHLEGRPAVLHPEEKDHLRCVKP
ncbi:ABC transporter ATP-binding protein [Oceanicola sp. 502str15]|uniref:ABC transporter ATP-binding protein n=1 Tax=Oceanicola sp. 502str15 TaxID=2696061 RepID=UPI0020958542|nr:ATP-binding cassette domain-containing protein [Oceanicola sp. 502str15]MCO6382111.1 ATP-binding cassette domain-containing protein [Oceanicola sp. 502str15]